MHTAEQAAAEIVAAVHALGVERVPLREALGRVLAENVISPVDLPLWNNASMDGYAVRMADVRGASRATPARLVVIGTIAAGARGGRAVEPGEAYRIMTGAPLPDGADCVIRVEDTDAGTEQVLVLDDRDAGRNVRPRGEDLAAGATAVAAGTRIGPGPLGVLASVGCAEVPVARRPRVAFLATGDELVDVDRFDEVRRGERIVTSNSYTLEAAVREAGGEPVPLGLVRDDPDLLHDRLSTAPAHDLLITSGGISVGEFDHTKRVLAELGAVLDFWRVRIRPGAPLGFGRWNGTPWIGLPGNPVSAMVTFELFAKPALRRMLGMARPFAQPVAVRVAEPIRTGAPLTHFLRGIVSPGTDGRLEARLTGPQGSGLLTSMARANALIIVPADRSRVDVGETLQALLLGTEPLLTDRPTY